VKRYGVRPSVRRLLLQVCCCGPASEMTYCVEWGVKLYSNQPTNQPGGQEIRYDTRCYFNVRSKADISQLNLPHGTDN